MVLLFQKSISGNYNELEIYWEENLGEILVVFTGP